ncbi:MAG: hypothetical protein JSW27_07020 [Phycisphaerales bacterium]|nr:MAG: hypothetical protein JSW27_07020 [Phycisphaerales bacterium]
MFAKNRNKKVGRRLRVVLVVLLGFSLFGPAISAEAGVSEEWEVDILAPYLLPDKNYSDIAFAPNGDLVYTVSSSTRQPCDSFLGRIAPNGTLSKFATPCIDHPGSLAFTPWSGDAVVMVEGAGYCDTIYLVSPGQATVFLNCSVVVNSDIQVAHDGSFFVGDLYPCRITQIYENKQVTYMDPAIPRGPDHEMLRLAMDSAGTLYLAVRGTNTIYRYTNAMLPREVYSTDFYRPHALAVDADDNLWVSYVSGPTFNIDILSPDGTITPWASGLPDVTRLEFGPDGLLYGIVGYEIVRFVRTDSDSDGVPDDEDAFPDDPDEWADADGDGVGDNADQNDNSDLRATVVVGGSDTGVPNQVDALVGLSIQDYINEIEAYEYSNHGLYVSAVAHCVEDLLYAGVITEDEADIMMSCAAQSDIGEKE